MRGHRPLLAILLLLVAVGYVVFGLLTQPEAVPVRDEGALLDAAQRLLEGRYADPSAGPRDFLWHGPGLPALLAPLVALEVPLPIIRLASPVVMVIAVVAFHRLLRRYLEPRPALLFTAAFALYAPFYAVMRSVHKEPLAILLVIVALGRLARGLADGRLRHLAGAGLALAALAMVRVEYGWVIAGLLFAGAGWWVAARSGRSARRLVAVAAIGLAGCAPWLAYTHAVSGERFYWGDSSGLSLYWMSPTGPGESGQWHSPYRLHEHASLTPFRAYFAGLDRLGPINRDRALRERAMRNIAADPAGYARNVAANAGRLLFFAPMSTPRPAIAIAGCIAFNGALLLAFGWGARRLWRRRRSLPPETLPFVLLAAGSVGVHLLASASPRMLLPAVPVLLGLVALAAAPQRRRASSAVSGLSANSPSTPSP